MVLLASLTKTRQYCNADEIRRSRPKVTGLVFKPHDRGLAISRGPFSASACFRTYRLLYLQAIQAFAKAPKGPYDNGPRVQALTLLSKGFKPDEIKADTSLSKSTIYELQKRALSRGYDPSKD